VSSRRNETWYDSHGRAVVAIVERNARPFCDSPGAGWASRTTAQRPPPYSTAAKIGPPRRWSSDVLPEEVGTGMRRRFPASLVPPQTDRLLKAYRQTTIPKASADSSPSNRSRSGPGTMISRRRHIEAAVAQGVELQKPPA
jgi:hypothetical protein